jgi:TRAP-type C4-dicarboxylate transport system substrate-binding protein
MNMKTFSVNVVSQMCQSVTLCQKKRFFFQKLSPSYRKVIKKLSQKLSQKLSKSCKKVVKKLSKSCQKVVKKLQKVDKGSGAMHLWSFYVSWEAIKKKKSIKVEGLGWGGWGK